MRFISCFSLQGALNRLARIKEANEAEDCIEMGSEYTLLCACNPNVIIHFEGSVGVHHNFLFTSLPTTSRVLRVNQCLRSDSQCIEGSQPDKQLRSLCGAVQFSRVWKWVKKNTCVYAKRPGKQRFPGRLWEWVHKTRSITWSDLPREVKPQVQQILQSGCNHLPIQKVFFAFLEVVQIILRSFLQGASYFQRF